MALPAMEATVSLPAANLKSLGFYFS